MMYIRLQERSKLFLCFSMLKLLLQVSLNLLLVVHWRGGVLGVVEGGVISSTLIGMVLTIYVALYERPAFEWGLMRRMLQFCWPLWLSGFAGLYIGSSGAMYLRVFGSLTAVGLLELGLKFATVVDMLIWNPFWQHWEPMSYRYYREADGRRKFQVAFIVVSALMFAGGTGNQYLCGTVIRLMASQSFYAASTIVPILTIGFVLNSLNSFSSFSFLVTGNTKIYLCQYVTGIRHHHRIPCPRSDSWTRGRRVGAMPGIRGQFCSCPRRCDKILQSGIQPRAAGGIFARQFGGLCVRMWCLDAFDRDSTLFQSNRSCSCIATGLIAGLLRFGHLDYGWIFVRGLTLAIEQMGLTAAWVPRERYVRTHFLGRNRRHRRTQIVGGQGVKVGLQGRTRVGRAPDVEMNSGIPDPGQRSEP